MATTCKKNTHQLSACYASNFTERCLSRFFTPIQKQYNCTVELLLPLLQHFPQSSFTAMFFFKEICLKLVQHPQSFCGVISSFHYSTFCPETEVTQSSIFMGTMKQRGSLQVDTIVDAAGLWGCNQHVGDQFPLQLSLQQR